MLLEIETLRVLAHALDMTRGQLPIKLSARRRRARIVKTHVREARANLLYIVFYIGMTCVATKIIGDLSSRGQLPKSVYVSSFFLLTKQGFGLLVYVFLGVYASEFAVLLNWSIGICEQFDGESKFTVFKNLT